MAKKGGHIEKRGDGVYRVTIFMGTDPTTGKPIQHRKTIHGTLKEAQKYLNDAETRKTQGQVVSSSKEPFGTYLQTWLEQSARPRVRERTFNDYRDIVKNRITPALGKVPLENLTPLTIQTFYNQLTALGYVATTVRNCHTVMHSSLKQAVRWRMLTYNPADNVDLPRLVHKERPPLLVGHALAFLEEAPRHPNGLAYMVGLVGGMRPSEYLANKWPDLNLQTGELRVQRTLFRPRGGGWRFEEMKTGRSRRTVILPKGILPALRVHRQEQVERRLLLGAEWENHDLIFCSAFGAPLDQDHLRERTFKRIRDAANKRLTEEAEQERDAALRGARTKQERDVARQRYEERLQALLPDTLTPYALRHGCATLLMEENTHPRVVAERLGHASTMMTMDVYSHVTMTMQQGAADTLDALLFPPKDTGHAQGHEGTEEAPGE